MISEIDENIIIRTTDININININTKKNLITYVSRTLPLPIPFIASFLPSKMLIKFLGVTVLKLNLMKFMIRIYQISYIASVIMWYTFVDIFTIWMIDNNIWCWIS
jgi:hypothetical protein